MADFDCSAPPRRLLEELHRQPPEGHQRKLRTYANVGLLCVDEVGYLSFYYKSADLLYEVIDRRYERKSVILTTNRPFKQWNEVFPNAACIVTLLDRLLHHADAAVIECESYRKRESELETADLPDTPLRASTTDQWLARRFHDDGNRFASRLPTPPDPAGRWVRALPDALSGLFPARR
jgi:hypothetical protein